MSEKSLLLVVVLVVAAGCVNLPAEGGPPSVEIGFTCCISVESGTFHFNGSVGAFGHRTTETYMFKNVSVVLYDADHEVIKRKQVGRLTTKPGANTVEINITSDKVPAYFVIESEDFWTTDIKVVVDGFRRSDGVLSAYSYTSKTGKFSG